MEQPKESVLGLRNLVLRPFEGSKGEMGLNDTTVACTLDYIYPFNAGRKGRPSLRASGIVRHCEYNG